MTDIPENRYKDDLEADIAASVNRPTEPPEVRATTGAEQIVAGCTEAITQVHDYTVQTLDGLIARANALKGRVLAERDAAIASMENYVALANDTLKVAERLDQLMDQVDDTLKS